MKNNNHTINAPIPVRSDRREGMTDFDMFTIKHAKFSFGYSIDYNGSAHSDRRNIPVYSNMSNEIQYLSVFGN